MSTQLQEEMVMYWGSILCPLQNPSNFYEYEWRKHGSCTDLRKDQYFQKVMDLYFRYDLATAFQDAGMYMSLPIRYINLQVTLLDPDKPKKRVSEGHFTHESDETESPWPLHFKHSHWWERRSRSNFVKHYAWGTNGVCECKMDAKSTWILTWHRMEHVSWSLGLFSKLISWR